MKLALPLSHDGLLSNERDGGRNGTAGCVVLENHEMDELWARCPVGTPVTIV